MAENNKRRDDLDAVSKRRRRLLQAVAGGSTGLIAGCSTSDGGDGGDGDGDGGGMNDSDGGSDGGGNDSDGDGDGGDGSDQKTPADTTFAVAHWYSDNPSELQYNPDVTSSAPMAFDPLVHITAHPAADSFFYSALAADWNYDTEGDVFSVELADSTWWHTGEQVTATDLKVNYQVESAFRTSFRNSVDSYEVVDPKNLRINLTGKFNPSVLKERLLAETIDRPATHYQKFAEQAAEASTEDEYSAIAEEIVQTPIDEPVGNTLFEHVDYSSQNIIAEIHGGHFNADAWQGIEQVKIFNAQSENQRWQRFLGGQADTMAATVPPKVESKLPDHAVEDYNQSFNMASFLINEESGPLGDHRVRQALAYIFDRQQISENMGTKEFPPNPNLVGFSHSHETYLGKSFVESQITHYEKNLEKAAQLLEAAGLTKQNGTWMWEGKPWKPLFISHGFASFVAMAQTGESMLKQFGIKANYSTVEIANLFPRMDNGEYEFAVFFAGSGVSPYFAFRNDLLGQTGGIRGYPGDPDNGGTVEVPPVGEPDGELQERSPEKLTDQLSTATEESELRRLRQELAWIYNQTLPAIQISPRQVGHTLSTDHWNLVPEDDPRRGLGNPAVNYPITNALTPKYE
jgi:peptide/nickel transport system substrate-binding protein